MTNRIQPHQSLLYLILIAFSVDSNTWSVRLCSFLAQSTQLTYARASTAATDRSDDNSAYDHTDKTSDKAHCSQATPSYHLLGLA